MIVAAGLRCTVDNDTFSRSIPERNTIEYIITFYNVCSTRMIFVTLELLQKGFGDSMESAKEFNLAIGLRIREVREGLKMTREQFSEKCDLSASFLATVENGSKSITMKSLDKICQAANVTPNYILYGKDEGYEADVVLEMLRTLKPEAKGHAVRMLKEYIEAIHEVEKGSKK